ncbi:MAG TPA: hypothetical protein VEA99_17040 [Gemmatimonadaceae bacterium]|nr:hypothetical protein [Gemmatimonadaceae bacterium]
MLRILAGLTLALLPAALAAQTYPSAQLHGFARWGVGRTDGNAYEELTRKVDAGAAALALNLNVSLLRQLAAVAQVEGHAADEREVELDFAFGEWSFGSALAIRAGRVKQPFGIATEVFDVGTLRPFFNLPQAVYGPQGFVSEGYDGAGVTGTLPLRGGWSLQYDAYGGQLRRPEAESHEQVAGEDEEEGEEVELARELVGGRLLLESEHGISVGASAYTGRNRERARIVTTGVQGQWHHGRVGVQSEVMHQAEGDEETETGAYLETTVKLTHRLQAATELSWLRTRYEGESELPELDDQALRHRELALGLNYWFSSDLVLKGSYHHVRGRRITSAVEGEVPRARTNAVMLSLSLAF